MKKILSVVTPLSIVLLLVSASTAVPHVQGTQAIKLVEEIEHRKALLEEKYGDLIDKALWCIHEGLPAQGGIIELLIQLILLLIRIVEAIIQFILDLLELGALIEYLIGRILVLIGLIIQFVEWLLGLFNPSYLATLSTLEKQPHY